MGAGAGKRLSAVRWGVAGNIVVAWVLTLPSAAIMGAVAYGVTRLFGTGAAGPIVVSIAAILGSVWLFRNRARTGAAPEPAPS